ncbi:MAG: ATP-binding protein [Desulfobacterales bacterium]|nr:ATP-binding protein [Desulfobacterales bacterium]
MPYLSALLPLLAGVISFGLGITAFYLSKNGIRKNFLKLCTVTVHWQLSWVFLFLCTDSGYADIICKIGYSGIIFLPVICYETICMYLKKVPGEVPVFYGLNLGFLACLWTTDLFILGPHKYWFGFYPEAGVLHRLYLVTVVYLLGRVIRALIRVYRDETEPVRKTRIKYFLLSTMVFSLSGVDYLLNYPGLVKSLGMDLYPFGGFFISFAIFIFILCHFIVLNMTLEKRVNRKTRQLSQSVKDLEKAASVKKNFIANITHELRTPLTLIRGWTDFMGDGEAGVVPENLTPVIDKIKVQTLSLTHKINELLKVSKFDAGMDTLALTRINIDTCIFQIVSSFRGLIEANHVDLNYYSSAPIPPLYIDREKLKDILNNLIRNAYKFTEQGEISVTLSTDGNNIVIEVRDTGVGMSPEVMETIFNRFQQGDNSKTRTYEGAGLGLAIVKESVERMYGHIEVNARENQWTCFTLTLPADLEKKEPESVVERRKNDRRKTDKPFLHRERRKRDRRAKDLAQIDASDLIQINLMDCNKDVSGQVRKIEAKKPEGTIVIAEDNPGILDLLASALKNYTLYLAGNGELAWETITQVRPDLVISDIMMPKMDGFTLLKKIRSGSQTTGTPVIIITSLSERNDRIKSLQSGADDFLTKPFHHLELQARVKNVISLQTLEREQTKREQLEVFLMVLASTIESKDTYTGGHVERVANYARDLAGRLGLPPARVNDIYTGATVHDVGKIGIRDEVLNKPGRLSDKELLHIRKHPVIGKNILSKLKIAPIAVNIAYCHHERWDGSGYPNGTRGKAIPLEARIATIADCWDAITSNRPYRKAMPLSRAVKIMISERGKSLDPDLLDLFMDPGEAIFLNYLPQSLKEEYKTSENSGARQRAS